MNVTTTTPRRVLKPKYRWTIIIVFILLTIFVKAYTAWYWPKAQIVIADKPLRVLVAKYPWQWQKGLGGRSDLGAYDGMLFLFPKTEQHAIVMRNMRFPLDIVWLQQGVVVDLAKNVPVEPGVGEQGLTTYPARLPSNMVLELPAGQAESLGLRIGDKLSVRP